MGAVVIPVASKGFIITTRYWMIFYILWFCKLENKVKRIHYPILEMQ